MIELIKGSEYDLDSCKGGGIGLDGEIEVWDVVYCFLDVFVKKMVCCRGDFGWVIVRKNEKEIRVNYSKLNKSMDSKH